MRASWKFWATVCLAAMMVVPAMAQEDGAAIYKAKCSRCHGEDGMSHTFDGKMTHATRFSDPEVMKMPDEDLIAVVKGGKKKMPSFAKKLTDDQIASVIAYIHTLQKPPAN
jgi:cytochrome c6